MWYNTFCPYKKIEISEGYPLPHNLANHERQFLLRNCKAIISFIKYTKKPIKLAP